MVVHVVVSNHHRSPTGTHGNTRKLSVCIFLSSRAEDSCYECCEEGDRRWNCPRIRCFVCRERAYIQWNCLYDNMRYGYGRNDDNRSPTQGVRFSEYEGRSRRSRRSEEDSGSTSQKVRLVDGKA